MTISASIKIGPQDSRCRYWAKIIRAGQALPLPSAVSGASDVPGGYLRNGEEEIFPGDFFVQGEEMHHRRNRGWTYCIGWCDADGNYKSVRPSAERKASLKAQGLAPELLSGSGDIAACIRIAHGLRAGLTVD